VRQWLLVGAVLLACQPAAPTELEGELGFAVHDAYLIPCRTAAGEQMVFGLIRSSTGCAGAPPRRRSCEGMASLLSYPFACQTGAIPLTLTADATLVWLRDVHSLSDLTLTTITSVEHRRCGGTPHTLVGDAAIIGQQREDATLELRFEELSGTVNVTVCD